MSFDFLLNSKWWYMYVWMSVCVNVFVYIITEFILRVRMYENYVNGVRSREREREHGYWTRHFDRKKSSVSCTKCVCVCVCVSTHIEWGVITHTHGSLFKFHIEQSVDGSYYYYYYDCPSNIFFIVNGIAFIYEMRFDDPKTNSCAYYFLFEFFILPFF